MQAVNALDAVQESNSQGLHYRRLLQLGSGGMATVHLALATGQSDFSRLVVVKAVREGNAASDEIRRMFLSEARLSARLNHPNVVQVSEVVESNETVMLVMEYLDGMSLAEAYLATSSGFTLPMRLRVLSEVLLGLHYAHELTDYEGNPLGIVHRDVSPQNVFLTYDGRVKLLDFGIAKATTLVSNDHTREGVVKGRVAYMPVEQFAGEPTDRRADVYAVGCMLWEAVAGTRLWGKASDVEILQSVWAGTLPRLKDQVDVDDELARIIAKAMAHAAEDRYPTAEALRLDLEAYLKRLPPASARDVGAFLSQAHAEQREARKKLIADAISQARSESTSSGSLRTLVTSTTPQPVSHVESTHTPPRRWRWLWPLAVAVIAGLGVSIALPALQSQRGAPDDTKHAQAIAEVEMAKLTVRPSPSDAAVYLDDKLVAGDPPKLDLSPGSQHQLRIELEGYETVHRTVQIEANTTMEVELKAKPRQKADAPHQAPKATPKRTIPRRSVVVRPPAKVVAPPRPATKPGTPAEDPCNPPFFFDKGIKTYKPECI